MKISPAEVGRLERPRDRVDSRKYICDLNEDKIQSIDRTFDINEIQMNRIRIRCEISLILATCDEEKKRIESREREKKMSLDE